MGLTGDDDHPPGVAPPNPVLPVRRFRRGHPTIYLISLTTKQKDENHLFLADLVGILLVRSARYMLGNARLAFRKEVRGDVKVVKANSMISPKRRLVVQYLDRARSDASSETSEYAVG